MNTFDWEQDYQLLHSSFPHHQAKPIIGLTGNFSDGNCTLSAGYYQRILQAGGMPVIIPPFQQHEDTLTSILDRLDAIVFTGGADMNPLFVGEEPIGQLHSINAQRDRQELLLVRLAFDRQLPILGICRGIQMLAAALGGSVWQDIQSQATSARSDGSFIKHSQDLDRGVASHSVDLVDNSQLQRLFRQDKLYVNSFHHQAVKSAGPHLQVVATAPDGVIEAVESNEFKPIMGVQWHPECFEDGSMNPLFDWLIQEANRFSQVKQLHQRFISLDSHCDTPMFFHQQIQFHQRDNRIKVDLHKMTEGRLDASIMVAYLPQGERTEESLVAATAKTNQILNDIEKMVAHDCSYVEIARTPADIRYNKSVGKKSILLGIENGYAIGKDLQQLQHFRNRGVVYMTLCHNGDNDICDSAKGYQEHRGVSAFGAQVIQEMNRLGMMVDLSHAHEKSFYDALEISRLPIVCSHSSARALCDHPRNLTDHQMKALADKGGVAQVTLYHGFLKKEGQATILDAIEHLNHMVNVMGIEHVGIGTDFDGDGGICGCDHAGELLNFTRHLLLQRYTPQQIELIWGANFLRLMEKIQNSAQ